MNQYKVSVIAPVIFLNEYSRKALSKMSENSKNFKQILFVIPCSDTVYNEISSIFSTDELMENVKIVSSANHQSNALRYLGVLHSETEYVYYQDCDDEVKYDLILESIQYCTGENVLCFNINRKQYDANGNLIDERLLYPSIGFEISDISRLMTNIVNKLIPLKYLKLVQFYNIPFSQDLSLSFQLFELCPHRYCPQVVYLYENNALSSGGIKKTKRSTLLRVVAIERILTHLCKQKPNIGFITYRYEILIQSRFAYLNEVYWPTFSFSALNVSYFGVRKSLLHLYHYMRAYFSSIKLYLKHLMSF